MEKKLTTDLQSLLQQQFAMAEFRPGQREAIEALLSTGRVLCIQPTGYGKSLIYQLSSLLIDGLTLVISPLLALMRDQVAQLNSRFRIAAASINSDQSEEENAAAIQAALNGRLRILFIAPEKLDNIEIFSFLTRLPIGLVVVDEAHCISTWGHDFRPAYRQIIEAVREFEKNNRELHVLGLTATANGRVEKDIAAQLRGSPEAALVVQRMPMDRPNIRLAVQEVSGMVEKLAFLAERLPQLEGSGILYCATRENTEIVAEYLSQQGVDVVSYHAGYDAERKRALQNAFMNGGHKAIAATNALGMGIDKADIRFIIHVDVPGSITAYYQEVGRAGRDGLPAQGILLFDIQDRRIQEHFIRSAQPTAADFDTVLNAISSDAAVSWPSRNQVRARSGLHPTMVTVILAELQEQSFVEKQLINRRQVYVRTSKQGMPELARYERQHVVRSQELEKMILYGQGETGCLMQTLRQVLGDESAQPCSHCSYCHRETAVSYSNDRAGIQAWLDHRQVPIPPAKRPLMEGGFSLLDGQLRQPLFVNFMRQRTDRPDLDSELYELLNALLGRLKTKYQFKRVVSIPSRTWQQRENTSAYAAAKLGVTAAPALLSWREAPPNRQGELLNNDQRRDNVHDRMQVVAAGGLLSALSENDAILLLDDYIGSGATMKEAVRALRNEGGLQAVIVPITIARVRWRLGARGMI
ncbi:MAG: RecQ family ATP-dependent DNA helicase [Candidatus Promineifilaceae bacterium]